MEIAKEKKVSANRSTVTVVHHVTAHSDDSARASGGGPAPALMAGSCFASGTGNGCLSRPFSIRSPQEEATSPSSGAALLPISCSMVLFQL